MCIMTLGGIFVHFGCSLALGTSDHYLRRNRIMFKDRHDVRLSRSKPGHGCPLVSCGTDTNTMLLEGKGKVFEDNFCTTRD